MRLTGAQDRSGRQVIHLLARLTDVTDGRTAGEFSLEETTRAVRLLYLK